MQLKQHARKRQKELKKKKLSNVQVSEIILKNKMHTMLEVLAHANSRKFAGDLALYDFILNRGQKKFLSC